MIDRVDLLIAVIGIVTSVVGSSTALWVALSKKADKEDLARLESKLEAALAPIDGKFDRIDGKFDRIDAKFDWIDAKFDRIEAKFDAALTRIDEKLDGLIIRLVPDSGS